MKIEVHEEDEKDYEKSLNSLLAGDKKVGRKLIVEGCVLAAANLLNMHLHKIGKLPESEDIKHNKLEGFLLRESPFGKSSLELSFLERRLEELKYKVVHGKEQDTKFVGEALEILKNIKEGVKESVG